MATALAPVAASVVGLALGTQRAEAATVSRNHVYALPGTTYSCFITITNEWPYDGHATVARGRTEVTGGEGPGSRLGEACLTGSKAYVGGQWYGPDGQRYRADFSTDGTLVVERLFAPVGYGLWTDHAVHFSACNCEIRYNLQGDPNSK